MNFRDVRALIFQRGWLTLSGAGTLFFVSHALSRSEQGLFFTFLSLAAIQSIFEAGITSIFFNFTAHERALLAASPSLPEAQHATARARLAALIKLSRRWFMTLAVLFSLLVGTCGYFFVDAAVRRESLDIHWQTPYFLLIASISLSLLNLSRIPILEGFGKIADIANFRLRSSVVSVLLLWAGMVAGWGLWALAICYLVQNALMAAQIAMAFRELALPAPSAVESAEECALNWRTEILPVQFRLAGSYFCGYFIAQAVVPFTLHFHGAVTAGQVGLMLSVFNALASIVASYMYAAAPKYAEYIAHRNLVPLAPFFSRVTGVTLAAAVAVYACALLAAYAGKHSGLPIAGSLPSMAIVACMAAIGLANAFGGSIATLLRAQKKDPMLPMSVAVALGYVLAMALLQGASIERLFVAFVGIQLCVATPMALLALKNSRLLTHRSVAAA